MIIIKDISVDFGGKKIFSKINFMLSKGDKIGLVGDNGVGKSTLLKVIYNDDGYYSGSINFQKNIKIGFLSQDLDFENGLTILEETKKAFTKIIHIENKINELNIDLKNSLNIKSNSYKNKLILLSKYHDEFNLYDGYNYQSKIEKILIGLGFSSKIFNDLTDTLSGGWRMRIELAKLLLNEPDILLLDEPNNHLDIDSIIFLEKFLKLYQGSIILVSHDKSFLDSVTNRTIEIDNNQIYDYNYPYSKYLSSRKSRISLQISKKKNQEKLIKNNKKLIEKFRYKSSKAVLAQKLIKKNQNLEIVTVDDFNTKKIDISFPESKIPGKVILKIKSLSKAFGSKNIISNFNFQINRGDRIAFVGKNGKGKSTLIRCIAGIEKYDGEIQKGLNVNISYFAQNQIDSIDQNKRLIDIIDENNNDHQRINSRSILGAFLFSGDDIFKKVKVLSGGEKTRLAICKLLLSPSNFLLLDEPTNHLDIKSKEVLKKSLNLFKGTLVIVSHDRDFLKDLTNKTLEFLDNSIKLYLGNISEYLDIKNLDSLLKNQNLSTKNFKIAKNKKNLKNNSFKKIKKLKNQSSKIERQIEYIEKEIKEFELKFNSKNDDSINYKNTNLFVEYNKSIEKLNLLMHNWEEINVKIENYNNHQ
ncbi:MAG: ABC transporter ATP-binding protein [Flavobacteriales bacterium TMED288]|nr:MAG: ABC transporter ATP-binding protein [Flavobacteriales bacterium TMED288]